MDNNFLYYQLREGVEPDSMKDSLVRNSHRMLHYRKEVNKTRYPNKIKSMRRRVRGNKNYKENPNPREVNNWNVPVFLRDYQFPH